MKACFAPALLIFAIAIISSSCGPKKGEGRETSEDRIE